MKFPYQIFTILHILLFEEVKYKIKIQIKLKRKKTGLLLENTWYPYLFLLTTV